MVSLNCNYREYINYLVENYDIVIWRKMENGDKLKQSIIYEKEARHAKKLFEAEKAAKVLEESSLEV